MAADGQRVFVGSFNLDPRSAALNSESGVVVDAAGHAEGLCRWFETRAADQAWRLELDAAGQLRWRAGNGELFDTDPQTSWWRRFTAGFLSLLPIDSQL